MTARERLPWFPFDAADWLASAEVRLLTLEERGVLIDLLCHAWRDGMLEHNPAALARLVGVTPAQFRGLWRRLSRQFVEGAHGWTHPGIEATRTRQLALQQRSTEHGRKAAAARWRQISGKCSGNARVMPDDATQKRSDQKKIRKRSDHPLPLERELDAAFAELWGVYPKHAAKQDALKAWRKLRPDAALQTRIRDAVTAHTQSAEWTKDGGGFVPHLATFLRGRRWEDELPAPGAHRNPSAAPAADAYARADAWCAHDPRCATREWHALKLQREPEDEVATHAG